MPAENIQDVRTFVESNANSEDVKGFVNEFYTPEKLNPFLDTDAGGKLLQPRYDKNFTKGLESWKEKNLPEIIDEEVTKRNPGETEEQKRLKKLEEQNQSTQQMLKKEGLKNTALKNLKNPSLAELVDFLVGDDETTTNANINILENVFTKAVNDAVKDALKNGGRVPPNNQNSNVNDKSGMNAIIRTAAGY